MIGFQSLANAVSALAQRQTNFTPPNRKSPRRVIRKFLPVLDPAPTYANLCQLPPTPSFFWRPNQDGLFIAIFPVKPGQS
jgi:hypothetical protein